MKKIRVFTRSLGCPKNLVDTENILGGLGPFYEPARDISDCDVVLINTCAFIRPAVEESLDALFTANDEMKSMDRRPLLAVTGCLVSRYGKELHQEIPEADIFSDIAGQKDLPGIIINSLGRAGIETSPARRISTPPGWAYLKISEGCNNRCSFCTIPSIRGRLESRPPDQIVSEAEFLLGQGIKELILVAQDSTAYGRDLGIRNGLALLLAELADLDGLRRIRVMYLYPSGLSRTLLEKMAQIQASFLPYFDIPFQHSHPEILARMGRPFKDDPAGIISRVRDCFPDASIRTTLITGYPGESQRHFDHLLEFVKSTGFNHLGVFPFYPEQGTRAAGFADQIPPGVRSDRAGKIMSVQKRISRSQLKALEGSLLDILVDAPHPEWPGLYLGRAWFQAPEIDGITYVSGPDVRPGALVKARVVDTTDYDLSALQDQPADPEQRR